jgi:HK97 gp10 family phage protein
MSGEIVGLDDLEKRLKELAKVLSKDEFLKSAKDGMTIYVEGPAKRNTPIDTGRLRNSETTIIHKDQVITGTNVEYAPPVEFGSGNRRAKPFMRPAWDEGKSKVVEHMEEQAQKNIRSIL